MRILMIANYLPYPQISGGRIRIYNLLRQVANRHEVSLVAFLESPGDAEGVFHLKKYCSDVITASFCRRTRLAKLPGLLRYALEGKPPELGLLHSEELITGIRQLFSTKDFDIVQIESVMGLYLETLPKTGYFKSIQMFQNFTSQQYGRVSSVESRLDKKLRTWLNSVAMGYWEPRYAERFDRCAVVSELDRRLLLQANPRLKVDVIPNGVDVEKYQTLPLPSGKATSSLLFIGNMGYPPCIDAAIYFCREIYPLIRQSMNGVEVWIVGRDPSPAVLKLNGDGVHVTGRVEDVVPYYQQSAISIVPLRAGGGTRLKILEAMALGRPVVSTTIGCEGLALNDNEHLLIGDTPDQFAGKILCLLKGPQLYTSLVANGRQLVETHYSWNQIAKQLLEVYARMKTEPSVGIHEQLPG